MAKTPVNLNKLNLDIIIGRNIRLLREAHHFTREELSETLGISPSHLGLIERGERGTTSVNMLKVSKLFNKPANYFFVPRDKEGEPVDDKGNAYAATKRRKIKSLLTLVEDSSLNFVISMLQGVIGLTQNLQLAELQAQLNKE